MYFKAFPRRRVADQLHDSFERFKRLPLPVACDVTEEPMFDLVPLAGSRREMADLDDQTCCVCEPLEFRFPQPVAVAVAAATICGHEQPLHLWVSLAAKVLPLPLDSG